MACIKVLSGHTSEETAHVTDDYPYGFVLRCTRKEWLEYKPKKGYRFVTMTSNPKRGALTWNKPKTSIYVDLAVLYVDEQDHVQWDTLHTYATTAEIDAFEAAYHEGLQGEREQQALAFLRRIAQAQEARRAEQSYHIQGSGEFRIA